jgi:FkbM family methyltransferase
MSSVIKKIFRLLGFKISKIKTGNRKRKSIRSKSLSLHETSTGIYYLPSDAHGDVIANAIKAGKIFEKEVLNLAAKYIKSGTAVLDVGSNFGQMAILFSKLSGEKGKVYAFDADDFVFDILTKNIKANGLENQIIPTFGAVHNNMDEKLFFPIQDFERFDSYGSYGIDYKGKSGREVPTVTIDSLKIMEPISFMKVDVQGGDLPAMQGAVETIRRHQMPILFEYEYHFEEELDLCFQDYVDFVNSIGYKFERVITGHNFLVVPK